MTGVMAELNERGDTKVSWDTNNADEVENARTQFDRLTGKGFVAYRTDRAGELTGQRLRAFDPAAERIVLVPQMQGG